ncbi:MAG: hypothetical protein PUK40_06370 [Actinomycetaceae bacterium]|nr:hypothetical protein [Actinomycetaceae bacterium]
MLIQTVDDLATLTDDELNTVYMGCIAEEERRRSAVNYLAHTLPATDTPTDTPQPGGKDDTTPAPAVPPEYVQPSGAHDAYELGALITHNQWVYQSLIPGNVWSPADYPRGWHKLYRISDRPGGTPEHTTPDLPNLPDEPVVEEEKQPGTLQPLPWTPGIEVEPGEQHYTYEGVTYEVIQGHTTQEGWEPPNTPALWHPTHN